MKVSITEKIDLTPAIKKIESDEFWLFGAKEWQRLLFDYIPHNTGQLRQNVTYVPKTITYKSPYAAYIYYGNKMVDPQFNVGGFTNDGVTWWSRPGVRKKQTSERLNLKNGSRLWDKKAIQDKKDLLLVRSMQNWINRNL